MEAVLDSVSWMVSLYVETLGKPKVKQNIPPYPDKRHKGIRGKPSHLFIMVAKHIKHEGANLLKKKCQRGHLTVS